VELKIKMMIDIITGKDQINNVGAIQNYIKKKISARNVIPTSQDGSLFLDINIIRLKLKRKMIGQKK